MSERHIVLVGLPGAGKSSAGPLLAHRLSRAWLDFDSEIERRTGLAVADLFVRLGEAGFRDLEREVTEGALGLAPAVLTPGGGWITRPENVALIRPRSTLVWLQVSPPTACRRLGPQVVARPLLAGDPEERLAELLRQREPFYGRADERVDTELLSVQQVVEQLVLLATPRGDGLG